MKKLLSILKQIGAGVKKFKCNSYLVGGPLRDILLGNSPKDIDIVIELKNNKDTFKKLIYSLVQTLKARKIIIHNDFGTATLFLKDGRTIDLAMARTETYKKPGALPVVKPSDIVSDLKRRDFSINSIALCLNKNKFGFLIDPNNGLRDIKQKKIRILHKKSFIDDPTRILRAIRFSTRLNFKIEKRTLMLLKDALKKKYLDKISQERKTKELILALFEKKTFQNLKKLSKFGIYLSNFCLTEEKKRMLKSSLTEKEPVQIKLSILLLGKSPEQVKSILKKLKFERKIYNEIVTVFRAIYGETAKNLPEWSKYFFKIAGIKRKKFLVTGKNLIKLGLKPGPIFKKILNDVNRKYFKNLKQAEKYVMTRYIKRQSAGCRV